MTIVRLVTYIFIISILVVFFSCSESNEEEVPKKTGILVVNEGNFGSGNGSISFYDEELMNISNNVVETANSGSGIGASVQSIYLHEGVGFLVCNSPDKIEFINVDDYSFVDNPETNISQPRYMVVVGDLGYITCWGPWNFDNWTLPDSYIAVMDLTSRAVIDTLPCGSGPEGIIAVGNKVFVANSFDNSISVINTNDNSFENIPLASSPQHFVLDGKGTIWTSTSAGLLAINSTTMEKMDSMDITNIAGKMANDESGKNIYLITAEPWPGTTTQVYTFNTASKILGSSALLKGENFYGIGYNTTTSKLYVADSKAFNGPGQIMIYDTAGVLLDDQISGVGPNGFAFK